jgi:anti-anti-sigma regulatory factor
MPVCLHLHAFEPKYGAIISGRNTDASFKRNKDIVGLFGLFGKKEDKTRKPAAKPGENIPSRAQQGTGDGSGVPPSTGQFEHTRDDGRNARNLARGDATAKKIDAIESAMSSEFTASRPASSPAPGPALARSANDATAAGTQPNAQPTPPTQLNKTTSAVPTSKAGKRAVPLPVFESTLPSIGMSTEFLLGDATNTISIEVADSETAQAIEEAAILFANDQTDLVEQVLQAAIADESLGENAQTAWWMLFDFLQITGKRPEFESLSIDYAGKFETSPPSWHNVAQADVTGPYTGTSSTRATAVPSVAFSGKLDGAIVKLLERVQKLAEANRALRLEFSRVTDVDPVGCGLLLRSLKKLQASEHDLVLVGAPDLVTRIRAILQVGRRDETEAPWLLMLEILRLLNREGEFEEASIDYCVTFEVSPPAFVAPRNNVSTDEESSLRKTETDCFVLPVVVDSRSAQVLSAVESFVVSHDPAIIDCSRLNRLDFTSAGQLLNLFAPLHANGKTIEMQNVNHLVASLLRVIGLSDVVRILPRKP